MVRSLVGALLAVGEGRRPPEWPAGLLRRTERASDVPVAPAARPHPGRGSTTRPTTSWRPARRSPAPERSLTVRAARRPPRRSGCRRRPARRPRPTSGRPAARRARRRRRPGGRRRAPTPCASVTRPVPGSSVSPPGPHDRRVEARPGEQDPSSAAQLGLQVGGEDRVHPGGRRPSGPAPRPSRRPARTAHAGALGGVGQQHRGAAVDGVLALRRRCPGRRPRRRPPRRPRTARRRPRRPWPIPGPAPPASTPSASRSARWAGLRIDADDGVAAADSSRPSGGRSGRGLRR